MTLRSLRRRLIFLRLLTVAVLMAASLHAETPQQAGQRLIKKCLEALGGQTFLSMRDKAQHGRAYQFYQERLSGLSVVAIYIRYDPKPSSPDPGWLGVRERREFGKKADYGSLFIGGQGWDITFRGARPFPEDYMRLYRERLRRDIFYTLKYRLDEPGMIFDSTGTEIIDNVPVDMVRVTDGDNNATMVYLLQSSHLPVRQEYVRRDPKTRETTREVGNYSKYRNVSGVQVPWNSQLVRDGEKIFEMFNETVEINKGLNDSVFELKKGVKVLPGDK